MPTQISMQMTEATMQQVQALSEWGFGTRTDIARIAIDRMYREEKQERTMSNEMDRTQQVDWLREMAGNLANLHRGTECTATEAVDWWQYHPGADTDVPDWLDDHDRELLIRWTAESMAPYISIDNDQGACTPEEAIAAVDWDVIINAMDDDIREQVHADVAPCSELEFLRAYLQHASIIIG